MIHWIFFVLLMIFIGIFIFGNRSIVTRQYSIQISHIPTDMDGKRLAVLTDLHCCIYGKQNRRLLLKIEASKPDLILIAGDLITGTKPHCAKSMLQLLESLASRYPVFYAPGNHEGYWKCFDAGEGLLKKDYIKNKNKTTMNYKDYCLAVQSTGVVYLANESKTLKKFGVMLSGLELSSNYYGKESKKNLEKEELDRMLGICDRNSFHILLAHDPYFFDAYADWGADLVLSGHVHGGLLRLPWLGGVISPRFELFPKYDAGVFEQGKSIMVLSRGLGSHTLPLRIFNRPELVVIELSK